MPNINVVRRVLFSGGRTFLESIPGASHVYSLRQLSRQATSVVRVRRSSDNAEQDFSAAEVSGGAVASFCGAGNGFVVTWYNQVFPTSVFPTRTGLRDATNSTAAAQFTFVTSGVQNTDNGRPCMTGQAVNGASPDSRYLQADNITNASRGDVTLLSVGRRTASGTYQSSLQLNSPFIVGGGVGSGSLAIQVVSPGTSAGVHNSWVAATTSVSTPLSGVGDGLRQFTHVVRRTGGTNGNGGAMYQRYRDTWPNNLTGTGTQTWDSQNGADLISIGRQGAAPSVSSHSGPLQEIVIYNRALSDSEIESWISNCAGYYNI